MRAAVTTPKAVSGGEHHRHSAVHVGPTTWRALLVETGQVVERRMAAGHREEHNRCMAPTLYPHWPRGALAASCAKDVDQAKPRATRAAARVLRA